MKKIDGVILAGGQATRMGGADKGLIQLNGRPLYRYVLDVLAPQVHNIAISANRNQALYSESGIHVFSDTLPGFFGPLAGMLSGLESMQNEWVAFVPCDVPFVPADIVERLWQGRDNALAAYIDDGERGHPTIALLHRSLAANLRHYLEQGERKLMLFLEGEGAKRVTYPRPECFINFNTPEDCLRVEQQLRNKS